MELYIILGGAFGALARKLGELIAMPDIGTLKGGIIEILVGGAGFFLLHRFEALPAKVAAVMTDPLTAFIVAAFATYLPINLMRNISDWFTGSVPATTVRQTRTGWAAWR